MDVNISDIFETQRGKKCVAINSYKFSEFRENKDTTKFFVARIFLKRKATTDLNVKPNKLIRQELRNSPKSENLSHSDVRLFRKSMYEARRKIFRKIPKSLFEAKAMTFQNKKDFVSNNEPFCFMDSEIQEESYLKIGSIKRNVQNKKRKEDMDNITYVSNTFEEYKVDKDNVAKYLSLIGPIFTVRPIALYASSTWATTKSDEKKLEVFERKILRKIFGPKKNNEGEYEIRSNKNLEELYNEPNITGILKSARIGWAGHVWRSKGLIGQITTWKPNAKRPRGRPRQRWADRIKEDLKMLGVRNAEETAQNREDWRQYVVAAMGLKGL
ncbi:hypothetical protein QTP88_014466 [Uroleucon formosanum]